MKSKGGSGGHADEDNDQMPYSQYVKKPGFAYYRDLAGWLALADNVSMSLSHIDDVMGRWSPNHLP